MECRVECLSTARALLGLADGADRHEISARYRALARVVHPDKGGSALLFQLVGRARELLLDPKAPPRTPPKAQTAPTKVPAPKKPRPKPKVRTPVPPPVRPPHTFGGPSEQQTFGTSRPTIPPSVRQFRTFGGPSEQHTFGGPLPAHKPPPMFSTPAQVGGAFGFRPAAAVRPLQSPDSFGDSFGFRHASSSAAVSLDQFGNSFA